MRSFILPNHPAFFAKRFIKIWLTEKTLSAQITDETVFVLANRFSIVTSPNHSALISRDFSILLKHISKFSHLCCISSLIIFIVAYYARLFLKKELPVKNVVFRHKSRALATLSEMPEQRTSLIVVNIH